MNKSLNPLSGKVALVTGGSRGIGAAIVRRLVKDGAAVAFTYSRAKEKAAALVVELERHGRRGGAGFRQSNDRPARWSGYPGQQRRDSPF